MKLYACGHCHQPLYFENSTCLHCLQTVGFDIAKLSMITLIGGGDGQWYDVIDPEQSYRFCRNAQHGTCNWIFHPGQSGEFCMACSLNRTIPLLSSAENLSRWKRIEVAKHRLVYSLIRLHLPVRGKEGPEDEGIAFDFMADLSPDERVMTGHHQGTITLNIEEADETERVRNKLDLGEKYRTLLGHFRHETGHYYWDLLIKDHQLLKKFRLLFGDEQQDYSRALENYYHTGAPGNWADHFISPYASSHPWEDWAETWAHYLHLMDTLETAWSFGIGIKPWEQQDLRADISRDPYDTAQFEKIIRLWLPLTFAVNSLNRSMGHPDFYPFVISPPVMDKLRFIHETCRAGRTTP